MKKCTACNDTGLQQSVKVNEICSFCLPTDKKNEKPKFYLLTYLGTKYNKIKNEFVNKNYTEYKTINDAKNDQDYLINKYDVVSKIIPKYK